MDLYLVFLVRAIFHFAMKNLLVLLNNPLVMSVAWGLSFLSQQELSQLTTFLLWLCSYQNESSPKVVDS